MNRIRRGLLKLLSVLPLSLTLPENVSGEEHVVIDGWVMRRDDIEPGKSKSSS